jgi:hypothetical protein
VQPVHHKGAGRSPHRAFGGRGAGKYSAEREVKLHARTGRPVE